MLCLVGFCVLMFGCWLSEAYSCLMEDGSRVDLQRWGVEEIEVDPGGMDEGKTVGEKNQFSTKRELFPKSQKVL